MQDGGSAEAAAAGLYDLAVASDCSYTADLCEPLLQTAARLLRRGGVLCLVHVHRAVCPDAALLDAAGRHGLRWVDTEEAVLDGGGCTGAGMGDLRQQWHRQTTINEGGDARVVSIRVLVRVRDLLPSPLQ